MTPRGEPTQYPADCEAEKDYDDQGRVPGADDPMDEHLVEIEEGEENSKPAEHCTGEEAALAGSATRPWFR
jgi:hypothetical protein